MNKYNDLELSVMSCLLLKPELMNELIVEDKHFIKYQRLWQFMKAFYIKFKNFDIQLMYSICKDKYHIIHYMTILLQIEPTPRLFHDYQKQIIELYNENENDKWIIEKTYELSNKLYVRSITIDEFETQIKKILESRNKNEN